MTKIDWIIKTLKSIIDNASLNMWYEMQLRNIIKKL